MATTLGELIRETNKYVGGQMPSQQNVPRATVIEDLFENPSYNGGGALGEKDIIGGMTKGIRTPPPIPNSYLRNNNQSNFSPNLDVSMLRNETRNRSFEQVMLDQPHKPNVSPLMEAPVYAGTAPPLKSISSQPAIPMNRIREKFNGTQSCMSTLNHIQNCPMCARYFQCDSRVYHVTIFMLIILFITILYFVCKDEHRKLL
jgi:hypothetical protein